MRLTGLLLLILLGVAVYFVAAPWLAFRSLRDAAKTDDVPALAQLIDYPAVRRGLAAQITGAPIREPQSADVFKDPIGAIKQAFEPDAPVTPEVERYLSAQALAALVDGRRPGLPLPAGETEPVPKIAFWNVDRCRIVVTDPHAHWRRAEFTFQRKGLFTWKVSRILLPPRGQEPSTGAVPAVNPDFQ